MRRLASVLCVVAMLLPACAAIDYVREMTPRERLSTMRFTCLMHRTVHLHACGPDGADEEKCDKALTAVDTCDEAVRAYELKIEADEAAS